MQNKVPKYKRNKAKEERNLITGIFIIISMIFIISVSEDQTIVFYVTSVLLALTFYGINYILKKKYNGGSLFLFLVLFSVVIYPNITMILNSADQQFYRFSNEYEMTNKIIYEDRLNSEIPILTLTKIKDCLKVIKFKPELLMFDPPVFIEENEDIPVGLVGGPDMGKREYIEISQGNFRSILFLSSIPMPPPSNEYNANNSTILAIEKKIKNLKRYQNFSIKNVSTIPLSDFYIESLTSFTTGDITPSRGLTKILNALQGLCLLFISTIIINSVNNNLGITPKNKK